MDNKLKDLLTLKMMVDKIDWSNPKSKISKYFTVHEATFLPSWGVYHYPSEEEKINIVRFAQTMDIIRETIGLPIHVHVWIRPTKANIGYQKIGIIKHDQYLLPYQRDGLNELNYNKYIGSKSKKSGHIFGKACDFHFKYYNSVSGCAEIRKKLIPLLKPLNIRMENITGSWIHIDCLPKLFRRFFRP